MARFNKIKKNESKTVNKAGGKAFKHSPEMELVVSCLSTFLKDGFYESGSERIQRIRTLIPQVKPEFVAKLALVARNDFHLRSVSHVLTGELAMIHRGDSLVSKLISKVAERPDDLTEIVSYVQKPIRWQVKKGVQKALLKFNRYQLAKYRGEGKSCTLIDLFNLCHPYPKLASIEQQEAWKDLMSDKLRSEDTWEARLSSGENKKEVWNDLVMNDKIGYMALLRNLRNINEQANAPTKKKACEVIANADAVRKSKQLPFRFYSAYQNVDGRDMWAALEKALDISCDNVPRFDGKTLVAVDGSGSMTGSLGGSDAKGGSPISKAAIFAAALYKSNDADLVIYDTNLGRYKILPSMSVLAIADNIIKQAKGGGTDTSLVFQYAIKNIDKVKYDRIVILSDNESWADSGYGRGGTQQTYNEYRKLNDCYVYAIDIAGDGTKDITSPKAFHIAGWSEKIFDFIKWIEKENQLVEFINKKEL